MQGGYEELINQIWNNYELLRENKPIVHCITNTITINDCANVLLAAGASPTMAHHPLEVEEITAGCDSLVCNFGAMKDFEAMKNAAAVMKKLGKPIVVDPVGVAGSTFRRDRFNELVNISKPDCIRGNYSEIRALYTNESIISGVDTKSAPDKEKWFQENVDMAEKLSNKLGCIVVASGKEDIITDGRITYIISNGDEMMTRITGSGCMLSALIGAFMALKEGDKNKDKDENEINIRKVISACGIFSVCGEISAKETRAVSSGTMTFKLKLIDKVFLISENELEESMRIEKNVCNSHTF